MNETKQKSVDYTRTTVVVEEFSLCVVLSFLLLHKMHIRQKCSEEKKLPSFLAYSVENLPLITNMCLLRFLKTFFRSKKSKNFGLLKKVKKSTFQTNGASLFPFQFRISKLSFSDTELKAESENLNFKVLERQLDLAKGLK